MVLPCSYAASQEEKDDLRDSRAGQHPQVPGQEGKKATDAATATGRTEKNHNQPGDLAGPQIQKTENLKNLEKEEKKRDGKEE